MHRFLIVLAFLALALSDGVHAQPLVRTVAHAAPAMLIAPHETPPQGIYQQGETLRLVTATGSMPLALSGPLLDVRADADHLIAWSRTDRKDVLNLSIYQTDGTLRMTTQQPYPRDFHVPHVAFASSTADAAIAQAATGEVVLLASDGSETSRLTLFKDAEVALERSLRVAIHPEGDFVAVAAMQAPLHPTNTPADNAMLMVFDRAGTLRWEQPLAHPAVQGLALSPDGATLFAATYDPFASDGIARATEVYASDGTPQHTLPIGFEQATFAVEAPMALLLDRRRAVVYDYASNTETFTFGTADPVARIVGGVIRPDGQESALVVGRPVYTDRGFRYETPPEVHVVDAAGQPITTVAASSGAALPTVWARPDGLALVLDTHTDLIPWSN